ncbi:hypothetical protein BC835DRAFT_1309994 [Cytidiella melzeri]|nr:hypothetical protein BC835DRAFT_1309994 [Cytidiella melzeri]
MEVDEVEAVTSGQLLVEEQADEEDGAGSDHTGGESEPNFVYVRRFLLGKQVGKIYSEAKPLFQCVLEQQKREQKHIHGPFGNQEEWDLAKWLVRNVCQNDTDEFLRLPIAVNALPQGTPWKLQLLKVTGDLKGDDRVETTEELELW